MPSLVDTDRVQAFSALFHFGSRLAVLPDLIGQARNVDKNILVRAVCIDKAESFGLIEKRYCS